MVKLKDFNIMREKWLEDSEVRKEYDRLEIEFQLAQDVLVVREKDKSDSHLR